MATDGLRWQRGHDWAASGLAALATVYFAIQQHWTSKDLVWSFWLTTLSSGFFLIAAPLVLRSIAALCHPETKSEDKRGLVVAITCLIAVFTLMLIVFHAFFFNFVDGLVPPIYERVRITVLYQGSQMISDGESFPVYYWCSLAAAAHEYWQLALLTLLVDVATLPWTPSGWQQINPFSAVSMLGERVGKLMVIQAVVLGLSMFSTPSASITVAVLVIAINFLPAGLFSNLFGEARVTSKSPETAQTK